MASSTHMPVALRPLARAVRLRQASRTVRSLSTTSNDLPPESPGYIDVPQPAQPQVPKKHIVKGVLPTPKRLFKAYGAGQWRASPEYLNTTAPIGRRTRDGPVPSKDAGFVEYKDRMTQMRRESLRAGLQQLKTRHEKTMGYIKYKSAIRIKANKDNLARAEREDERLTGATIVPTVEDMVSKPLTAEQIAEKRARYELKEAAKAAERRNNLHTLYMNARDFIVTEDQLNAKINEVFDDPFWQNTNDPSIWAKEGIPERMQDIISRDSGHNISVTENFTMLTKQRLQAISEELTGGKMEDATRKEARAKPATRR